MTGMAKEILVKQWRNVTHRVIEYPNGHIYKASYVPKHGGGAFGRDESEFCIEPLEPCDCCGLYKKVLVIDTSEAEYGGTSLCLPCITDLFAEEHLK